MSNVNANINISINSQQALGQLRALQNQISAFNQSVIAGNVAAATAQRDMARNLTAQINATKGFTTSIANVETSVSRLSTAIDKNKLSLKEYFRYGVAASGAMGRGMREHADIMQLAGERVKRLQTQYIALEQAHNGYTRSLAVRPTNLFNADSAIAIQRQQIFNKLLGDGSTALVNWGKNTQWAGRQLMVGFTVPLTIFGGIAGKIFMDLEKQVVQFKRVYGDLQTPTSERNAMVEEVKELAKEFTKYGIAVSDTIALAAKAAATGAQGEDLLAATTEATRLATLGQIDYQQALDATISLQTALGISSNDLAKATDFLNAVENQTVTSLDDITQAIPLVAPVIKGLGGDVKDLAIFMTAMREGGISANEGANALKSGLASLINPTKAAREQLGAVGINIDAILSKNKGDLRGLITEFGTALGTLGKFERQQTLAKMFGKYQFARMGALFSNIAKEGSQAQRVIDLTAMSAKELGQIAEGELGQLEESVGVKFTAAVEKLKLAIAPIGESFLKIATPIIDFAVKIADAFNNLPDAAKTFITWGTAIGGVLVPTVIMLVGLLGNFAGNMLKIGAAIGRLMGKTNGLSAGFEYLSMEELDAMAAAASLEGQTNSLTGALNVQRNAVGKLAAAYGSYTAAAGAAAASLPQGFRGPARKMATGGFVAGTGNKDSEPALLMPGEFVVNKKAAQENASLLVAMNEGTMKRYADGTQRRDSKQSGSASRMFKSDVFVQRALGANISAGGSTGILSQIMSISAGNIADVVSLYVKEIAQAAGTSVSAITKEVDAWRSKNSQMLEKFQLEYAQALESGDVKRQGQLLDTVSKKFTTDMETAGGPMSKFAKTASTMFPELSQDLEKTQRIIKETNLNLQNAEQATEFFEKNAKETSLMGRLGKAGSPYQVASRAASSAMPFFTRDFGMHGVPVPFIDSKIRGTAGKSSSVSGLSSSQMMALYGAGSSAEHVMKTAEQLAKEATGATGKAAGVKSPSKITRQQGKDVAKGLEMGIREGTPAVADAGSDMGKAAVTSSQSGAQWKPTAGGWLAGGASPYAPSSTPKNMGLTIAPPAVQNQIASNMNSIATESGTTSKRIKAFGQSLLKGNAKLTGSMFALDGLVFGLSMMNNSVGNFAQQIMPAVFALQGLQMILPTLMPLLSNPIGLVATALIATVGSIWAVNTVANNMARRGRELSDAMYGTAESMNGVAEFFNKKTFAQKLAETRIEEVTGEKQKSGTLQEAAGFVGSDQGQKLLTDIKLVRDTLGSEAAAKALKNQLERMMLSGIIGPKMGVAIATEIGDALGSTELGADVAADITSVVGLSGERLKNADDRLKIMADIMADASDVKQSMSEAGLVWDGMGWVGQVAMVVTGKGTSDITAENVAGDLLNSQSLIAENLAKNKLDFEKGIISAKQFFERNAEIIAQGKELGMTYDAIVGKFKSLYAGEDLVHELNIINQTLVDSLRNSLVPELGPQIGPLFDDAMKSAAYTFGYEVSNEIKQRDIGVDLLDAESVSSALREYDAEITDFEGKLEDAINAGDSQLATDIQGKITELKYYRDQLADQQKGAMTLSMNIAGGVISASTIANLLKGGKTTIGELTADLSVMPDDNAAMFLTLLEETGGEGAVADFVLNVIPKFNGDQIAEIGPKITSILALPEEVTTNLALDWSVMTPEQVVTQVNSMTNSVDKKLKSMDTEKEVKLYMRDEFSWVVDNFAMDWNWIAGLDPLQKFVYFNYITTYIKRYQTAEGGTVSPTQVENWDDGTFDPPQGTTGTTEEDNNKEDPNPKPPGGGSSGSGGEKEKTWLEGKIEELKANGRLYGTATKWVDKLKKERGLFFGRIQQLRTGTRVVKGGKVKAGFARLPEQLIEEIGAGPEGLKRLQELLGLSKKAFNNFVKRWKDDVMKRTVDMMRSEVYTKNRSKRAENILTGQLPGLSPKQLSEFKFTQDQMKDLMSNPEWVEGFLNALKKGKRATNEYLTWTKKWVQSMEETVEDTTLDDAIGLIDEAFSILEDQINLKFDNIIKPLEKQITLNEDLIDVYEKQVDAKQEQIDDQQRLNDLDQQAIDNYNRDIEMQNRKIEGLRREDEIRQRSAEALQRELDIMSRAEQDIRESYQKRVEALDSVAKLNDRILQSQQDQLNIGKALSEGDVYAAAQAAAEMQRNSVQYAAEQNRAALEQGMENQVAGLRTSSGLSRVQAEAQIQAIQDQSYQTSLQIREIEDYIYNLKQTKILPLEDAIYARSLTIRDLQNEIYDINENSIEPLEIKNKDLEDQIKSQERIRDLALEEMVIGEFTKAAWEQRKNELNLATVQAELNALALNNIAEKYRDIAEAARAAAAEIAKVPGASAPAAATGSATGTAGTQSWQSTWDAAAAANQATLAAIRGSANGGMIQKYAVGSVVGTGSRDSVPAMLTPGEYVIRKSMVDKYGLPLFEDINQGSFTMPRYGRFGKQVASIASTGKTNVDATIAPVYNTYSVNVNASTNASPDDIANTVINKIRSIDSMSIRRVNGY